VMSWKDLTTSLSSVARHDNRSSPFGTSFGTLAPEPLKKAPFGSLPFFLAKARACQRISENQRV
jgi:hypothetical protein